jgi:hypothetical protein
MSFVPYVLNERVTPIASATMRPHAKGRKNARSPVFDGLNQPMPGKGREPLVRKWLKSHNRRFRSKALSGRGGLRLFIGFAAVRNARYADELRRVVNDLQPAPIASPNAPLIR